VATGAVECLAQQYPEFQISVSGTASQHIFQNNPHVSIHPRGRNIRMENPLINDCDKRQVHFLESYCHHLSRVLKINLQCNVRKPYLYLSAVERSWKNQVAETGWKDKFWLINAGWKDDYTVKKWRPEYWQEVVNHFQGKIKFVQVGKSEHNHPELKGVINFIDKTCTRQLIRLCYHAQGVLTGESFLHHIAAALEKPAVTLVSGFLPVSWVTYPTGVILSRQTAMSCTQGRGCCWKSRVVPLGDGDSKDYSRCVKPVDGTALCMDMIQPVEVIRAVESFFNGGRVPSKAFDNPF